MDNPAGHGSSEPDFTLLFQRIESGGDQADLLRVVKEIAVESDPIGELMKIIDELNAPVVQTFYSV